MTCGRWKADQPIRHPRQFTAGRDGKPSMRIFLRTCRLVSDHHHQMIEGDAHALTGRSGKATPPDLRFGKASIISTNKPVTSLRSDG